MINKSINYISENELKEIEKFFDKLYLNRSFYISEEQLEKFLNNYKSVKIY